MTGICVLAETQKRPSEVAASNGQSTQREHELWCTIRDSNPGHPD